MTKRVFNVTGTKLGDKIKAASNLRKSAIELYMEFREEEGIDTDLFRIVGDYPPYRGANKEDSYDIWLYIYPTEKDKAKFKDQLEALNSGYVYNNDKDKDYMVFKSTSDIGISFKKKCIEEALVTQIPAPNIEEYFNTSLGYFKCTFKNIKDINEQHIILEGKDIQKDETPEGFIEITN